MQTREKKTFSFGTVIQSQSLIWFYLIKINYLAFGMFVYSRISALITGHPPETFITDNSQELCQNSKKGFQQIMDQTILLITGSEQNADIIFFFNLF